LLALVSVLSYGQKKPLDHSDYDGWKSLGRSIITEDAKWISYEINPQKGDGFLNLYDVKKAEQASIENGWLIFLKNHLRLTRAKGGSGHANL